MSLTSILKQKEMKAKFRKVFPVPKVKLDTHLIAPLLTKNHMVIGAAFDYLLRFHVKQIFPEAKSRRLIAQNAANVIRMNSGKYALVDGEPAPVDCKILRADVALAGRMFPNAKSVLWTGNENPHLAKQWADAIDLADQVLDTATENRRLFARTGEVTDGLIKSCLGLARMDAVFRTGRLYDGTFVLDESEGDVTDMRRLLDIAVSSEYFVPEQRAILNPSFGEGSSLVGGADADLILDHTLIDIKTTINLKLTQDMYNQILGYCALSTVDGTISGITSMGIYFSRHALLHTMPVPDGTDVIIEWFKEEKRR